MNIWHTCHAWQMANLRMAHENFSRRNNIYFFEFKYMGNIDKNGIRPTEFSAQFQKEISSK